MKSIELLCQILDSATLGRIDINPECWQIIDRDLDENINGIASCDDVHAAALLLEELGKLQELLAKLRFKYHVSLPSRLRSLVHEFDRCDDADLRAFVFSKIKKRNFLTE